MKKRLTNNFSMKIISLLLAVLFWLVVTSVEDPTSTKNLTIPVTKINEELIRENDKTYEVITGNTVTITVEARNSILKSLTENDFQAVADFANLSFTGAVPIEVTATKYANQMDIIKGANTMMQVTIEDLASVDKVVSTKAEGTVITGKALGTITIEPNMIRIEGAKTIIDRIASVYAIVNVSGISEDCSFVVEPVLYDEDGVRIDATDITFSEKSLKVNVTLLDTKTVPVKWNIDVTAADGFGIASKDYSPSEITIAGTKETLETITEIQLEDYTASDLTESLDDEVDINAAVKDMGASIVNQEQQGKIKLAVKVEPYESKASVVEFDNLTLKGKSDKYKYSIAGDSSIKYNLVGMVADFQTLDAAKLGLYLDVTDLEAGTHTLVLQMDSEQKVWLESEVSVKIHIEEK